MRPRSVCNRALIACGPSSKGPSALDSSGKSFVPVATSRPMALRFTSRQSHWGLVHTRAREMSKRYGPEGPSARSNTSKPFLKRWYERPSRRPRMDSLSVGARRFDSMNGVCLLCQKLPDDGSFFVPLLDIDEDLAEAARRAGCPCGGVLHRAPFWRKPRGLPAGLGDEHTKRLSFCCAVDGCRKRMTPPSVRFLGRKVYLGAVVVLATAARPRLAQLRATLGASVRTLARWRDWWRGSFVASRFSPSPRAFRDPQRMHLDRTGVNGLEVVASLNSGQ